ncbi:MAG: DNA polymerase III subunit delta' [Magnetococcales bacterium]|nr:DNA polymerase III subunit delta' [Magnetococcales bacterium]
MSLMVSLNEILGQQEAVSRLQQAMETQRQAHAYLFFGPDGVGKETTALAMAQLLFCRDPQEDGTRGRYGCGQCSACIKLEAQTHPDLARLGVEEGKTRIVVDQVRELTRFLALTPLESPLKVAIVSDAALMNQAAANALLKTLEEPPADTLLILVTAHPGMLLPTIRSRCQKLRFGLIAEPELKQLLMQQTELTEEMLTTALAVSRGSLSRGLEYADGKVAKLWETFQKQLGGLSLRRMGDLLDCAAFWANRERFPTALSFLKTWFNQRIRDNLSVTPGLSKQAQASWLELAWWMENLLHKSAEFNLNRTLVLEGIMIRIARLQDQTSREKAR